MTAVRNNVWTRQSRDAMAHNPLNLRAWQPAPCSRFWQAYVAWGLYSYSKSPMDSVTVFRSLEREVNRKAMEVTYQNQHQHSFHNKIGLTATHGLGQHSHSPQRYSTDTSFDIKKYRHWVNWIHFMKSTNMFNVILHSFTNITMRAHFLHTRMLRTRRGAIQRYIDSPVPAKMWYLYFHHKSNATMCCNYRAKGGSVVKGAAIRYV